MKLTIRNKAIRISLFVGFGIAILLLTVRHYYEATTFDQVRMGNQSIIQTIAVLNNTIELTLELSNPTDAQVVDTTAQTIYKSNRSARNIAAISPLLDSLVVLTVTTPALNTLARQLQVEAKSSLQVDILKNAASSKQIQRLVRSLRTFRLALADSLLDSQKQINEHIATMRTLNTIVDTLLLLLAGALLTVFYRYTLRRERLTKQVLNRQKELTQYLEAIPEGVLVLNTDKQIVYINQAAQQALHISPDNPSMALSDLANQFRLAHADSKVPYSLNDIPLRRALQGEAISTDNMLLETDSGSRIIASHARPLHDRDGYIVGAISVFRDITEARQKEQELQQARTTAEQSLREREIFLANISHDIRTPLNAILGFTEILRQKCAAPDEKEYLNGIHLSSNNLLALVNELLDVSNIESGQLLLEEVPTAVSEILQRVGASLSIKAAEKGLRAEVLTDPDLPPVLLADPLRLTQILLNFSSNAIKFTKEGFVRLSVRTEQADQPGRVYLVFTIEDSGNYITETDFTHFFNRFSQVASDTLFRSAGTGLGLNIAHSLVSLMHGTVTGQSNAGQGTAFVIRMPFMVPETAAPLAVEPDSLPTFQSSRSTLSVLIVEDNEMNQKVLKGFLNRFDLKPTLANNGLEAVTLLEKYPFDLIFMDIQMPEMDGYMATKAIRQELGLTTPIIAMTAYTMPGERERCLAAGMNEYQAKPIRMEQIDDILTRYAPGLSLKSGSSISTGLSDKKKELIDQAYLEEVTGGDNELLGELLALFVRDLPQYRQLLFEAIETSNRGAFNKTAHTFRSSLNSLAMLGLSEKLKQMETDEQVYNLNFGRQLADLFQDINQGLYLLESQLERSAPN